MSNQKANGKGKVQCAACGEKVASGDLRFNEAQHDINICTECGTTIEADVRERKVKRLVKDGTPAKDAKKQVAEMKLDKATLKAAIKLVEEEESAPAGSADIEVGDDEDETEIANEVAKRKARKSKKEEVAAEPAPKSRKSKKVEEPAPKSSKKKATEPVKEKSARQIRKEERAKRREEREARKAAAEKSGKPARTSKKVAAEPAGEVDSFSITIEASAVTKLVKKAISDAKEELSNSKIKKGTSMEELITERATEHLNSMLGVALVRKLNAEMRESGFTKTIRRTISKAASAE